MDTYLMPCAISAAHRSATRAFSKHDTAIHVCPDCGCIMANVAFCQDQYEADAYYTMSQKTREGIELEWGFRWRHVLRLIRRFAPQASTLLDVGAGNGYFTKLAREEFAFQAAGLEISDCEIRFAKDVLGVELLKEDVTTHRGQYDVVTCFNVIEHVASVRPFFSALVSRMKPGGLLIVTTPNPACIHARILGLEKWNMVNPPHHINLLTRRALKTLSAFENLQEVHCETLSTYVSFVRKVDTSNLLLRRLFFNALRAFDLGADHCLVLRRTASLS